MATSTGNSETLSDNGSCPWIELKPGDNSVSVNAATWGGSTTAALEKSDDATDATKSAVTLDGTAISLTGNDRFIITGPGFVRITVASYSGSTAITLKRWREVEQW